MSAYARYHDHTEAFIALCKTAFNPGVVLVGDGERPPSAGWQSVPGQGDRYVAHLTVYPIGTSAGEGSTNDPQDEVEFEWQTTIVAGSRAQGEVVFDLLAAALIDVALVVPGRACTDHLRLTTDGGGVRREEFNQQPPLWTATPRWAITTVPE